jgi:hypothetical protein
MDEQKKSLFDIIDEMPRREWGLSYRLVPFRFRSRVSLEVSRCELCHWPFNEDTKAMLHLRYADDERVLTICEGCAEKHGEVLK